MLKKPDERVISAFASLEGNHDIEVIKTWIVESKQELVKLSMESRDDVLTRWHQGAYQALDFLSDYAGRARSLIRNR